MEWATKIQAEKFRWHNSQWLEMVTQHQMEDQGYDDLDEDGFMSPHDMLLHMPDDYLDSYPDFYNQEELHDPDSYGAVGVPTGYNRAFEFGFAEERGDDYGIDERMALEEQEFLEQQYGKMMGRGLCGPYGHAPPTSPYRP